MIDIGPTERRNFASPRYIFERLAANDETASVGHISRMDLFSQNRGKDCHIHALTHKVSGSPIIIPADIASLAEPIAIMARAHAAAPHYDYDDCRVVLTFSQKPILAGQTNMNSTAIHLDVDDYKALLAGTYRRRNSFIVSDQRDYTTRFYTHPITVEPNDITRQADMCQGKALEAAILRKCLGTSPFIPKAGEIIRFTECCPHKANPIRTQDDGIVRTLLIVDFYQDTDRSISQNPALESYLTRLHM